MAEQNLSQLTPIINADGLKYVEHEGQVFFSSEEIGRQLGYAKPSKSINILFNRNQRELKGYATGIKLMQVDGCLREVRCFTEEGVYILSMLANTPRAREFRAKLARLLREIRERRVDLARESGYLQGLDAGRASALPEVKAAEAKARQDTARLFWRLGPARKRRLRSAVRYRKMGLGIHDIAKLLDVHNREVSSLLDAAEALGLLPPRMGRVSRPVQGNLLEVGA